MDVERVTRDGNRATTGGFVPSDVGAVVHREDVWYRVAQVQDDQTVLMLRMTLRQVARFRAAQFLSRYTRKVFKVRKGF